MRTEFAILKRRFSRRLAIDLPVAGVAADPLRRASHLLGFSALSLRDYRLGTLAPLPALLGHVSLGAFTRAGL